MLSSSEIIKLAFAPGAGMRGGLEAAKRKATGQFISDARLLGGRTGRTLDPATKTFFGDLSKRSPLPTLVHIHPAQVAGREGPTGQAREGLTPAEIVWLERLPNEPSDVTFLDATALARLNASVDSVKHRGDKRLIESIWFPVRDLHDRLAAEAGLSNASKPIAVAPQSAVAVLAQAIQSEKPDLTEDEALERAKTVLESEKSQLERLRNRDIASARAVIDSLAADEARRAETVRAPAGAF